MKNLKPLLGLRHPANLPALDRGVGVALARDHHAHRRLLGPLDLDLGERAIGGGHKEGREVALQPGQDHLAFGITEAGVVLKDLGLAVSGDHQAGVEHARERPTLFRKTGDGRDDDRAHDLLVELELEIESGRDRAHAAGVRTLVPVLEALVILDAREGHRSRSVAQDQERNLFAGDELLDDHAFPGLAETIALQHRGGGFGRLLARLANHGALARGQAVGLDHAGETELPFLQDPLRVVEGTADRIARRGHVVTGEEFAGKDL